LADDYYYYYYYEEATHSLTGQRVDKVRVVVARRFTAVAVGFQAC
jgi:hypothetical protein